jgi:acetyl-CoA carboxylase biotin carboxylase subunit
MDSHVVPGYRVPPTYDSMIAKLIVHGPSRESAIKRTAQALEEFQVGPIKTTIPLHREMMADGGFVKGGIDIHYLERKLKDRERGA